MPLTTESELALKLYEAGLLAFDQIKLEVAVDNFNQAVKEDPDFFMAHYWLYFITGKSSKKIADRALQVNAELSDGEREIQKAFRYLVDGQAEKVVEHLKNAVDLYPEDPQVHKLLYIFQFNYLEDMHPALESIRRAIDCCPDFPLAYNQLGYVLMDLDQMDEAGKAFESYRRLAPGQANPYDSKGDFFMKTGQYDSAYYNYSKAYEIDPVFTISAKKASKAKMLMTGDEPQEDW